VGAKEMIENMNGYVLNELVRHFIDVEPDEVYSIMIHGGFIIVTTIGSAKNHLGEDISLTQQSIAIPIVYE
jgi:hypothetical protein